MKRFIYILIAVLGFILIFNIGAQCQSDAFCNGASPFCTGTTYNFPLNTGTSSQAGPDYGCLLTQPNPVWYYLQIDQSGDITINLQSTPGVYDVDFIAWGPFTSATGACTAGLTSGNEIDCSYSTSDQEECNISNAISGQFYLLLITNFSNQPTNVAFSQTNTGAPGAGTTDCSVMTPCNITAATANPSACNPGPNTYSVSGSVTFVNPPASGTITVTDQPSGITQTLNMPFTSPMNYNLTGLNSDGAGHTVTFAFSADPFCTFTVNYTAPASCNSCNADAGTAQSVCGLSTTMAAVPAAGDYNMSWSYTGGVPGVTTNNPNSPNAIVTVPSSGSYTFTWTITNQFGLTCSADVTIKFTNPPTSTFTFTPILCFDNNTSTFTFTGSASAAATYSWNLDGGTAVGNVVTWTTAGNHVVSLTVTEVGCPPSTTTQTLTTPLDLVTSVSTTPVPCNSGTNGAVIVNVSGGVSGYTNTFDYCTCSTAPTLAGNYSVTITDANGCFNVEPFTIAQPQPLTVTQVHTNLLCNNDASGTAGVNVSGGAPGYTYSWSNNLGLDSPTQTGLQAGNYTVSITDINGCLATIVIGVTEPPPVTVSLSNISDASCSGVCDGSATAFGTGGTSPIVYNWGTTTSPVNNALCAGNTIVTVTDANGCTANATAVISEPALLTATITNQVNELCFGGTTGSATVTGAGGTGSPNYQYNWTNGSPNQTINNLTANTYGVVVTDANGCTAAASVIITQPTALGAVIIGSTDASCFNVCDGTASVTGSGGTAPYSYDWGAGINISALCAGPHTVTVTDANGCSSSTTANIFQPTQVVATIVDTSSVSCFGGNNGDATVSGSGGTPGYTYAWNAGSSTSSPTNTGLSATTYSVTVYDSQNCSGTTTATITEPAILNASASVTSNFNGYSISCYGLSDANIDLTVSGGSVPYTYSWSNSASSQDLSNVAAGPYNVTVTDSHGCVINASASTTEPPQLSVNIANISSYNGYGISCAGLSDGNINININGGVSSYSYLWSNLSNSQNLLNVAAGNYSVVVTDANGCTAGADTSLSEPTGLSVSSIITHVDCYGFSSGSIDFSVNNGVPPYSYMWNNTATTQDLGNIAAGTYIVIVSDANNCLIFDTIVVNQPTQLLISVSSNQLICSGEPTSISVVASGGTPTYFYYWNGQANPATITVSPTLNATYSVYVIDNNGCNSDTGNVILNVMPPIVLTLFTDKDSVCMGFPVYLTPMASGGDGGPYTLYNQQGNPIYDFPLEMYPAMTQNFVFSVKDQSCDIYRAYDTIAIKVMPNPTTVFFADKYAGCEPFTVSFNEQLNEPGTSYEWSFNDNGAVSESHYPVHTFETPGIYDITLNVTDKNGCQGSVTNAHMITVYPKPEARFNYSPEMVSIINPVISFYNLSENAASYFWSFGDGDSSDFINPIHTYQSVNTFEIYLFAITDHGCIDSSKTKIVVRDEYSFYAPSAFSPDMNGINDVFKVFGKGIDPAHFKLTVSDRWGQLLFETSDPNVGWNGKYMNISKKIANGTYVWMVTYQDLGRVIHQKAGHVTLIH